MIYVKGRENELCMHEEPDQFISPPSPRGFCPDCGNWVEESAEHHGMKYAMTLHGES
jgi:hypothetical protein